VLEVDDLVQGNAALRLLHCEAFPGPDLVDDIVSTYGRELDAESVAKIRRYLETLASTGKRDNLTAYGLAYLEQLCNPDPRYTGR
jgi:hypothetical protein